MNTIIKITRADLARKSRSQLAALFQQASLAVSASQSDLNTAQSALAMIDQELARRDPVPLYVYSTFPLNRIRSIRSTITQTSKLKPNWSQFDQS